MMSAHENASSAGAATKERPLERRNSGEMEKKWDFADNFDAFKERVTKQSKMYACKIFVSKNSPFTAFIALL
jgi:hypothetical protein